MMRRRIHSLAVVALAVGACVVALPVLAKNTNEKQSGIKFDFKFGNRESAKDTNYVAAAEKQSSVKFNFKLGDLKVSSDAGVAVVGEDYELKEGKAANDMAVVGGNAIIAGKVKGSVAVVFGSATLKPTAVIGGDVAVVGGSIQASSNAVVRGSVVTVGGGIKAESGFKPGGEQVALGWSEINPKWLKIWANKGLLRGALLPWSVAEVWIFVTLALAFNLLLSLLFPRPLQTCADTVRAKPVQSFLFGLLLLAAFGPLCLLLAVSCVGILAIPFLAFAVLVTLVFGFIAVYCVAGRPLAQLGCGAQKERPLLALAIGTVICNLAYMLPAVGVIAWGLVMMLGFGAAWLALISRPKRNVPPAQPPVVMPVVTPPPAASPPVVPMATAVSAPTASSSVAPVSSPPVDVTMLPRADGWARVGAALLDCILISLLVTFCAPKLGHVFSDPWPTLLLLVYFVSLWTWRGTTIGCAICGLKIVRTDGRPLTFGVAIVRALASLLSLAVIGLGFFAIESNREKQAWHDKVAGTFVVRMPKGVPLI